MFIHDVIKIMYTAIGYLPNYPHYLISDEEMITTFCKEGGVFEDYYPCPSEDLAEAYQNLKDEIYKYLDAYLYDEEEIPDWVYSYMMLTVTTYSSEERDISYLYELTGVTPESTLAEFSADLAEACYRVSVNWLKKLPSRFANRPPTMFGEAHVIKSLRLDQANILIDAGGS